MNDIVRVADDADHVELMLMAMHANGVTRWITTFRLGEECVAAIGCGQIVSQRVVIDAHLPGLDGPCAVARVRGLGSNGGVAIVMLSTSDQPEDARRPPASADSCVRKPRQRHWLLDRDRPDRSSAGPMIRHCPKVEDRHAQHEGTRE